MSNFNLDNAGSGFALDDGDDLNSLLDQANDAVEPVGDENTASYFDGVDTAEIPDQGLGHTQRDSPRKQAPPREQVRSRSQEEPAREVPQEAPVDDIPEFAEPNFFEVSLESEGEYQEEVSSPQEDEPADFVDPQDSYYQEPEAPASPEPAREEPAYQPEEVFVEEPAPAAYAPSITTPSRMHIPSLADDLNRVKQVIRVVDAYRALNTEERSVASQFITGGEEVNDEGTFVVKVLNVDSMLAVTMKALREAKALDDVERSFFVIELQDNILYNLGALVGVFMEEEVSRSEGRSRYARQLVRDIARLDSKAMNFVTATESVLVAAEEES